jgi:predicted nucleic acid-binding protein
LLKSWENFASSWNIFLQLNLPKCSVTQGDGLLPEGECPMREGIADSQVLMHYDNGHSAAIDWWETKLEEDWELNISLITCMERLKGVSGLQYNRQLVLHEFQSRVQLMLKGGKMRRILPITRDISKIAYNLLGQYCLKYTPPPKHGRMEALICDMFIAATALKYKLVLFTQNLSHFQWITELNAEKPNYNIEGDEM